MMTDNEWNIVKEMAFPLKAVKAPPFLWTRILALIESEEVRRASTWWMQWRWMSRITATVGLIAILEAFYLFQHATTPLEAALDGRSNQEQALQLANSESLTQADTVGILVGLDS